MRSVLNNLMSRRKLFSHIHRAWRLFPKSIRRRAFQATTTFLAQPPLAHAAPLPRVTVCGPLSSSIGIGWGAREYLAMLESAGFDTRRLDVADSILFARDLPEVHAANSGPASMEGPGTLLIDANPPQLPYLFLRLGRQITRPKYVIGYCVWELPQIPANWRRPLRLVHRPELAGSIQKHQPMTLKYPPRPIEMFESMKAPKQ